MLLHVTTPADPPETPEKKTAVRLDFLDGIRGLAAFYVVLTHMYQLQWVALGSWRVDSIPRLFWLEGWLRYGHFAVDVFIVLSGYCLMLPVARSAEGRLRGGARGYLLRRARRILPPYYAALILSLLLSLLAHRLKRQTGQAVGERGGWPPFSLSSLVSHLFLVHNLNEKWAYGIDSPMWSVATEWQIYFLFPALLLPAWRHGGIPTAVCVGFLLGLAPLFLLPSSANFNWACPWYLGLFALGMAAADIEFAGRPKENFWKERISWGGTTLVLFLLLGGLMLWRFDDPWVLERWDVDALVGLIVACALLACVRALRQNRPSFTLSIARFLAARATITLGLFSYSLYLVHDPVLYKLDTVLRGRHLPVVMYLAALWGIGVPLVLASAYLFHLAFERRFLSEHYRRELQRVQAPSGPQSRSDGK